MRGFFLPRLLSIARTLVQINAPAKATEAPKLGKMQKMLNLSIWQIKNAAMDESLANGFKNQLFREMPDRVAKLHTKLDKLLDKTKAHTKLTNWRRFANAVEPELLDIGLLSYEGGTKRKRLLTHIGMH